MERLYQMHVVPDALPEIRPSIDLHVVSRTTPSVFLDSKKVQTHVVPGTFLRPKQVIVVKHACRLRELIAHLGLTRRWFHQNYVPTFSTQT